MKPLKIKSVALSIAMLGFAAPAMAQEFCGGAGAGGQWIGGDEAGSDIATAGNYQEQMALVLGGNDYVSLFTLSAPTEVRVEAEGRGAGDPLIDLLDSNGNIILSDDDSGGNGAARGEVMLDPGTYCMAMQSYDGAPMTAFVRIGRTEQEALTAGSTDPAPTVTNTDTNTGTTTTSSGGGSCAEATPLGDVSAGVYVEDSVDNNGFWSFTLDAPMAVSITAENEDADPVLTLYDEFENYIDENDDFDGLNSRLDISNPLSPGTYCIAVTALNDTSLPIGVSVNEYDAAAVLAGLYARGEAAPPLDGSVPFTELGELANRLRQDAQVSDEVTWYTIDVRQGGLLLVEAIAAGGNGDPWLIVYDDLGREVGQNDDYGSGYDSLVTARVSSGTYIVGVKQLGEGTSGFVRMVFERYIPAP